MPACAHMHDKNAYIPTKTLLQPACVLAYIYLHTYTYTYTYAGIKDLHGLRVAYLSGHFPLNATGQMEMMAANALVQAHSVQKPIDVLLTAQVAGCMYSSRMCVYVYVSNMMRFEMCR